MFMREDALGSDSKNCSNSLGNPSKPNSLLANIASLSISPPSARLVTPVIFLSTDVA